MDWKNVLKIVETTATGVGLQVVGAIVLYIIGRWLIGFAVGVEYDLIAFLIALADKFFGMVMVTRSGIFSKATKLGGITCWASISKAHSSARWRRRLRPTR